MKFIIFFLALSFQALGMSLGDGLADLRVQDGGRIKPFDTFARESLQLIYGKSTYNGKSATEVVMTWILVPEPWQKMEIVELRHSGLKEALKLDASVKYMTPAVLFSNDRIRLLFQELQTLTQRKEKLNPYYQAVQRLENQLGLLQAIQTGQGLRLAPQRDSDKWLSVSEFDGPLKRPFIEMSSAFVQAITSAGNDAPQATPELLKAVETFKHAAEAQAPDKYGDETRIALEIHYNHMRPFLWAWIAYLMGILLMAALLISNQNWAKLPAWIFLLAGFSLHAYGIALRIYLAGRPPVSNMYETVVWVGLGTMIFGFILGHVQKSHVILICSSMVATLCLILTDLSPTVLDGSIHPLEPVLRSTFWLTTHVLIITISYAAFFLAFAIGDLVLFYYLTNETGYSRQIHLGIHSIYRALQIGVVLLAFGIILGGIWADYSWGRFWGWDPKETWALIALLGYLALLHGRLIGWLRGFGLAAGSVVAFSLVIMSWYGVNFVLGAGLHSYGFGAGGVEYVTAFVVLHLCYVAYVSTVRYGRLKENS